MTMSTSLFLMVVLVVFVSSAAAGNSVGNPCTTNSTCSGVNEYCQQISWLSPSCETGMCQCLPCHTTGDFTGYSWTNNPCARINRLSIGDHCQGVYYEQFVSKNALCFNGVVACKPNFVVMGNDCVRLGLGEDETCEASTDCAGDMWCGLENKCECYYSYERFNAKIGACVKKDLGDSCLLDDDCRVSGRNWNGFTWSSAQCIHGTCRCGRNLQVTAAYLDGETGLLKRREICIDADATVGLFNATMCHVDPVYNGDSSQVKVCSSDYVCFSCPEDNDWSIGKCRKVVGPKPTAFCHNKPVIEIKKARTAPPVVAETTTGLVNYEMKIPAGSTVGKYCTSNSSCSGANEFCQSITWLNPTCESGICQCLPCYVHDPDDPAKPCSPVKALNVGDACTVDAFDEVVLSTGAECYAGRVACKHGFNQVGLRCAAQDGGGEGAACLYNFDCSGELLCRNETCQCPNNYQRYNSISCECVNRVFGDVCKQDDDCMFASGSHWNYTRTAAADAVCINGHCDCNYAKNFMKATLSYVDPGTGFLRNRFVCITAKAKTNLIVNSECSLDPVFSSSDPSVNVKVCASGHTCFQCPSASDDDDDAGETEITIAKCRQIVDTMPVTSCFSRWPKCDKMKMTTSPAETTTTTRSTTTTTTTTTAPTTTKTTTTTTSMTTTTTTEAETTTITTTEDAEPTTNLQPVDSPCETDDDCAENEECAPKLCSERKCLCKDGFKRYAGSRSCVEFVKLNVGEKCDNQTTEDELRPHTVCKDGIVTCNSYYQIAEVTNECVMIFDGSYGTSCGSLQLCLGGGELWCNDLTATCLCYGSEGHRWDNNTDKCVRREYGDDCSTNQDCAVFGSLVDGGYNYGGGICSKKDRSAPNGKCACSLRYVAVSFSYLDAKANKVRTKTICVHRSSTLNVPDGQPCTLDPIYFGDNPLGQTHLCQSGHICARCPDTASNELPLQQGHCMTP